MFESVFKTDKPYHITLTTALQRIADGSSKETIEKVREGDKKAKTDLPVVLFSGEFTAREDDQIISHSGLVVLDFDHIDVEAYKNILCTDDHILACWVSPSGDGLKALVRISNPERHRDHFRALQQYFDKQYNLELDSSGANESRACFESYDEHICIKEDAQTFGGMLSDEGATKNANATILEGEFTDYQKLNIACRMIRTAQDGEKHSVLLKASILVGGYIGAGRIEEQEAIRVLEREIARHDVDSMETARNTIRDGVEQGKQLPIREVMDVENEVQREQLIESTDMSFISSDDEDLAWINALAEGKLQLGLDTGNEALDEHFRYKKDFFIFNGHSNVGKTTMALYLMVNSSMRHGWKWLIYSAENKTASIKSKLMQFAGNRRLESMSYHERKFLYEWVNEHFVVISNKQVYTYYDLIIFAEKMMKNGGIDAMFIDPYNSLKIDLSGRNQIGVHQYHYEAASEFLTFANKHDIALWLNTHAVTEAQRRKGQDGLPVAPFAEDTEGGGLFVNRADSFATFHRKIQHPEPHWRRTMEFHMRKVREVETGGRPTPFLEPLYFELNGTMTGFSINGQYLFQDLFTTKNSSQQQEIKPPQDLSNVF
jgi:hypothetical protein